jgi:hypothetical protein
MRFVRRLPLIALLIAAALPPAAAAADPNDTRAIMARVFDALAYLLPRSLVETDFAEHDDGDLIDAKLDLLAGSAKDLVAHTAGADAELRLLARSFERNTRDIRAAFREGYRAFAYYALLDLTEHCAACHARLPDARHNPFGQRLMARMNIDALDPEELAQLYVATRQFDEALNTLERRLLDPDYAPLDADLAGTLINFMSIEISVMQSFERSRALLGKYLERPDLPFYIERRIGIWQRSMDALEGDLKEAPVLARARDQFATATGMTLTPSGRERAVHDLVAAGTLRRFLAAEPDAPAEVRAEGYFLLALIALRTIEIKPAVPEMELLLEAAIRTAPKGPHAVEAYALLEEFGFLDEIPLSAVEQAVPILDLAELRRLTDVE